MAIERREPSISPTTPLEQEEGTENLDKAIHEKDFGEPLMEEKITKKKKTRQETLEEINKKVEKKEEEKLSEEIRLAERIRGEPINLEELSPEKKKIYERIIEKEKIKQIEEEKEAKIPKEIEAEIEGLKFQYKEGKINSDELTKKVIAQIERLSLDSEKGMKIFEECLKNVKKQMEIEKKEGIKIPPTIEELEKMIKQGKISPEEIKMMGTEKSEFTQKDVDRILFEEYPKQKEEKERIKAIKREEMENKEKEVKDALKEATMELAVADVDNYFAKEKERRGVSWFSRKKAAKKEAIQKESINAENEYNKAQKKTHNLLRQKIALEKPELEEVGGLYGNLAEGTEDVVDRIFAEDLKKGKMTVDEKWVKINEALGKIYDDEELPQWYIDGTRESHITLEGMKEKYPEIREEKIREKLKSYNNEWDKEIKKVNERISEIQEAIIKSEKIKEVLKENQEQNKEKIENLPQEKRTLTERLTFKKWREEHPKAVIAIEISIGAAMIGGSFVCPVTGLLAGFMYGKLGIMSVASAEAGWSVAGIAGGGSAATAVSNIRDLLKKRKEGKIVTEKGNVKTETEVEVEKGATGEYVSETESEPETEGLLDKDNIKETRKKIKENFSARVEGNSKIKMNIFQRRPEEWEFYQKLIGVSSKELKKMSMKDYLEKLKKLEKLKEL